MCHPNLACSLRQAALLTRLSPMEIEWAIEEFGRCDTDTHTVWPADGGDFIVCTRPR